MSKHQVSILCRVNRTVEAPSGKAARDQVRAEIREAVEDGEVSGLEVVSFSNSSMLEDVRARVTARVASTSTVVATPAQSTSASGNCATTCSPQDGGVVGALQAAVAAINVAIAKLQAQ